MILADAVASGADPDAISMCESVVSWLKTLRVWLMTSRTDSAAWAIAFTINTWAASVNRSRIAVYKDVHTLFSKYKDGIKDAQWLEKAEKLTDADGHKKFRSMVDDLLKYANQKKTKFSEDTKSKSLLAKRVMWCAAMASVIVIVFGWFYNFTLALLLPYPLFCLWHAGCGRWAMFRVWWKRLMVERELQGIEKRCNKSNNEPPQMDELRKMLDV